MKEKVQTVSFFPKGKHFLGFPRKFVVVSRPLCSREYEKLKVWLESGDIILVSVDSERRVILTNETQREAWAKRKMGK